MVECSNLEKCGFVKKYKETKSLAVKGFINMYCKSEKQSECIRKQYKQEHGTLPPDNMMPNGAFINDNT